MSLTTKQAVAFAILMQNNEGILTKAPNYIKEKLLDCELIREEYIPNLFDEDNQAVYEEYIKRWGPYL